MRPRLHAPGRIEPEFVEEEPGDVLHVVEIKQPAHAGAASA
jgi:hypothetical protein